MIDDPSLSPIFIASPAAPSFPSPQLSMSTKSSRPCHPMITHTPLVDHSKLPRSRYLARHSLRWLNGRPDFQKTEKQKTKASHCYPHAPVRSRSFCNHILLPFLKPSQRQRRPLHQFRVTACKSARSYPGPSGAGTKCLANRKPSLFTSPPV